MCNHFQTCVDKTKQFIQMNKIMNNVFGTINEYTLDRVYYIRNSVHIRYQADTPISF